MVHYEVAFKKPFTDVKKLIIGIALSILPIINWFAKGFVLECSGLGKNKQSKKMPEWKNPADLFYKGFIMALISFLYMLPGLLVMVAGFLSLLPQFSVEIIQNIAIELQKYHIEVLFPYLLQIIPFVVAATALFILASYVLPSANLNFLKKNNVFAAFNLHDVFVKAFHIKYFLAVLTWFVLFLAGSMILGYIPFIGAAILYFISDVIGYTLIGQAYSEAK